ncbi:response regulator containing a CheY-like receiver domain and an HTH DNA-binding domain [Terriglobus roseus DSM 18391]|uniref:Response regulator containing a CheY-like receiver domain and an HTH DNA-binding domain n=1 Tax=Terriglobus roseus (strain DSM 18391 / NRRL B-41598 / KBS 63) TaxID=926566 RepID=I3ZIS9_TERRK|nr:response regulator transcription factor [Terriglobus roseus]AFL89147.1 response regulator containing a CheY-like receiver domain and an HTH DNA-binding domain [Terriglobus roseus DSM 18391]
MAAPIRLLLVDDHHVVRRGFAALLRTEAGFEVVAEASDGEEAVTLFQQHQPDVTLMDLRLPGMSGVDAINKIREQNPTAKIIVLTTFDGDEDICRALQAGAKGYLLKGMSVEELIEAIRAVNEGRSRIPFAIAEKLAERMGTPRLTKSELKVLQRIAEGRSNKEIGTDLFVTEATVKTHINSLLSKLKVNDRTQAVTAALQRGILHLNKIGNENDR